jgi:RND family efflux transporter MFP subunit
MIRIIKHIISGFLLFLVILAAVFLVRLRQTQLSAMPPPTHVPMPVEVAVVSSGTLSVRERYLGRIQPIHSAALASNVAGYLMKVSGYPGDTIASGDVLIRVDDRVLIKKVAALKAELEGAKKELSIREKVLQRNARLMRQNAASEQQYDFYKMERDLNSSKVDRLKEELANAKIEMGYAEISAPFSGIILQRLHEPGDRVQPGEQILEIECPAQGYKVLLQVPPLVLEHVTAGSTAYLYHSGRVIEVNVTRVFPMVFSTETLVTLEIDLTRRPFGLPSGTTVGVGLVLAEPQGLQVPVRALLENYSRHYVFKLVAENRVQAVLVSLLGRTEAFAAVYGDLAAGDKVIVADEAALLRLGEGSEVFVTKELSS